MKPTIDPKNPKIKYISEAPAREAAMKTIGYSKTKDDGFKGDGVIVWEPNGLDDDLHFVKIVYVFKSEGIVRIRLYEIEDTYYWEGRYTGVLSENNEINTITLLGDSYEKDWQNKLKEFGVL